MRNLLSLEIFKENSGQWVEAMFGVDHNTEFLVVEELAIDSFNDGCDFGSVLEFSDGLSS